jgi:multiple sugar transport system permease protein
MRASRRSDWARVTILLLGLFIGAVPFVWVVFTAFKLPVDAAASPPAWFAPWTLVNWQGLLASRFFGSLTNSVIITVLTTAGTLLFGVPAGYAFARGNFRGRAFLAGFLLFSRMMPPILFIIPMFLFFHQLKLINTYLGLTLAYLTGLLPFTVWMCASYFKDIPADLEEAARVDGASRFQAFRRVALPLAMPGVLTVAVLIAIAAWSEYFIPLILAGNATLPATVALVSFIGFDSFNWGPMAAASLTLILPVLVLTLIAQRGLLRGLTAGAVKG